MIIPVLGLKTIHSVLDANVNHMGIASAHSVASSVITWSRLHHAYHAYKMRAHKNDQCFGNQELGRICED